MRSDELIKYYSEQETAVLLAKWSDGGLLKWAEPLLRKELLTRGMSEPELEGIKLHGGIATQISTSPKSSHFFSRKMFQTTLTIIWLLIQGIFGLLALASGGDILFYGSQYSSQYKYWALSIFLIALIPRFVVSNFPVLSIPYLALNIAAIYTATWCISNHHLSSPSSDNTFFWYSLYMLIFLLADASFILVSRLFKKD